MENSIEINQNNFGSPLRKTLTACNLPTTLVHTTEITPSKLNTSGYSLRDDPILIVDIKLVKDKPEKIVVMENDVPEELVDKFC